MRKRPERRGVILVITLFFMVIFSFLAIALYQLAPDEVRRTAREKTLTEAHYACTAGIRYASKWLVAVATPVGAAGGADDGSIAYIGEQPAWTSGRVQTSGVDYPRTNNEPFSVPSTDPTFEQTSLGQLRCPYNRIPDTNGLELLGLKPDINLTASDYNGLKARKDEWLALRSKQPLRLGDLEVYTYIIPSPETQDVAAGRTASTLKSYLVTTIAYRHGQPQLRARTLLAERSASAYAYRNNQWGEYQGRPTALRVGSATDQLFDGPVHTNETPIFSVASSYWDAPLQNDMRAINGTLTFGATARTGSPQQNLQANLTPNADGVAWVGGNYGANSDNGRPHDNGGSPLPSAAGPGVSNRYDRFITGGKSSIRETAASNLPADLDVLKTGAFGRDTITGLNSATNEVDPSQRSAVETPTVTIPERVSNNGSIIPAQTRTLSGDNGLFVNVEQGTDRVAAGIVVKGDTRNMFLEVTNTTGMVTDVATLESGQAVGNPTIRVQSNQVSFDSQLTQGYSNYVVQGQRRAGANVPTGRQVPAHGPHPIYGGASGGGSGMGAEGQTIVGYDPCTHMVDETVWDPNAGPMVDNYVNQPIQGPKQFYPQDWVVDVKNVPLNITSTYNLTGATWKNGVGGQMQNSSANDSQAKRADELNIQEVYIHQGNNPNGTLYTDPTPMEVPVGKVAVFKQNRSDSRRLDVYILSKPKALTGAVFGTGDINGLRGVNMDRKTIGVDYAANKGISIMDSVWQYGTGRGAKPNNAVNGLGLVATRMNVQTDNLVFSPNVPLRVYATIIAGKNGNTQGLQVSRLDGTNGTNWGRDATTIHEYPNGDNPLLQIMGGLTEQKAVPRLIGFRGFSQKMVFDPQLARNPPPFFPSTNELFPITYSQERPEIE